MHHTKNQEDLNLNEKRLPADANTEKTECENYLTKILKQHHNNAAMSYIHA